MEVSNVSLNTAFQQPVRNEKPKEEKLDGQTLNTAESVNISLEAQALYNGGGHPERPIKPVKT